jgi:NAD(P)-dependent dehydrogenase (short-subunit alcohol dehydrogenase family)
MVLPADMSLRHVLAQSAQIIIERLGKIDALVNCAGANSSSGNLRQLSPTAVEEILEGNLQTVFLLTLAVLPTIGKNGAGDIVHQSSWSARRFLLKSATALRQV